MPTSRGLLFGLLLLTGCDRPSPPATPAASPAPIPGPKAEPPKTAEPSKKEVPAPTTGRVPADQPYVLGAVRVTVKKVTIGKVPLKNTDGSVSFTDNPQLMIALRIENLNDRRKLAYESWVPDLAAAKNVGNLTDDTGTAYQRVSLGFGNNVKDRTATADVGPSGTINDLLLFEVPVATAKYLDLDLPGANCQVKGTFQFRIDAANIVRTK